MTNRNKQLVTGNEAAVLGALAGGAEAMFGYPITPATEILQGWINKAQTDKSLHFLQTEDETSAGFAVCGALLNGTKAFTASAGPGHVLMQDPVSMAENIRLPFVGIMMQRGGPSTGTVNFSQQEVNLAAFGGNGDGLRIVYSASTVQEMYDLSIKIFNTAWKYMFPTFLLGDGYLGKMESEINLTKSVNPVHSKKLLREQKIPTHLKNCYSSEEELAEILKQNIYDWNKHKNVIAESDKYRTGDASEIIVAHGLVASAAKEAVDLMRKQNRKIGLFRAITVHPLDTTALSVLAKKVKKIHLIESSQNQFSRIVKYELYGETTEIVEHSKPAEGFSPSEIVDLVQD